MIEIGAVLKMAKPRVCWGGVRKREEKVSLKVVNIWSGDIKSETPERADVEWVEKRFKEGLELQVVADK